MKYICNTYEINMAGRKMENKCQSKVFYIFKKLFFFWKQRVVLFFKNNFGLCQKMFETQMCNINLC